MIHTSVHTPYMFRLASFGLLVHGPLGHFFYGFLDGKFPGVESKTVALKVRLLIYILPHMHVFMVLERENNR